MSWTQTELDALRKAYASGTLRVRYGDKDVQYASEADLKRRIETLEAALAAETGRKRPIAGYAGFDRGDR